jgi:hypothetical protein
MKSALLRSLKSSIIRLPRPTSASRSPFTIVYFWADGIQSPNYKLEINSSDLAENCGVMAPGVTDLPVDQLEKTIHLNDEQLKGLDALKAASSQVGDILQGVCSSEVAQTPLDRLDSVQIRYDPGVGDRVYTAR